jgi:hypothetical protein
MTTLSRPTYTPAEQARIDATQAEQQKKAEDEHFFQLGQAYRFLRNHLELTQCPENGGALCKFLEEKKLPFTVANLEEAYAAIGETLVHAGNPLPTKAEEPLKDVWANLTRSDVAAMRDFEFRKNLKDPNFRAALDRLGIRS